MDYIRKYDIELEKEQYYSGETLRGWVVIENAENLRISGRLTSIRAARSNQIIANVFNRLKLCSQLFCEFCISRVSVFVAWLDKFTPWRVRVCVCVCV